MVGDSVGDPTPIASSYPGGGRGERGRRGGRRGGRREGRKRREGLGVRVGGGGGADSVPDD